VGVLEPKPLRVERVGEKFILDFEGSKPTVEQWEDFLRHQHVAGKTYQLDLIGKWYLEPFGCATCADVAAHNKDKSGKAYAKPAYLIGKDMTNFLENKFKILGTDGKNTGWIIPFEGWLGEKTEDNINSITWKIRDELYQAINRLESIDEIKSWHEKKQANEAILKQDIRDENEKTLKELEKLPPGSDKEAFVKSRTGQGALRNQLLKKYGCKCCICGLSMTELLVASHIIEWKDSTDDEKTDHDNGLLLCAQHDALFDKHLISFDKKGRIVISKLAKEEEYPKLCINKDIAIKLYGKNATYLEKHREKLMKPSRRSDMR
jgi:predicted HNH restriction endonuclease